MLTPIRVVLCIISFAIGSALVCFAQPVNKCDECKPSCKCAPCKCPVNVGAGAVVGGYISPDGKEEMQLPIPGELHQKNTGGSDGYGLCVYASARHAGRWQSNPLFEELFEWMKRHPGGSYPSKFTATLKQCATEKGYTIPTYVQVEDNDLEIIKTATNNGFMPGVTYGFSPSGRYNGQRISHMVTITHATDNWFCVLDNNYPGESNFEWMKPSEFARVYSATGGRGWSVFLLANPPSPAPRNKTK